MKSIKDQILFQDHHLVVAFKPSGMPVQDDQSGDASLHRILQAYCKQDLQLLNRLDRPVSGLVIFSKNSKSHTDLVQQLNAGLIKKQYLAIVEKNPIEKEAVLQNSMVRDGRQRKSYIGESELAKESRLEYKQIAELDNFLVLLIVLNTGRFHQIRAQLSHLGVPIKSDVKYGARRGSQDRSIGLHAWKIEFKHPSTGQTLSFKAELPANQIWPVVQNLLKDYE